MRKNLSTWVSLLVLSAAFLVLHGCSQKLPMALGRNYEVYVVADDVEWDSLGTLITEILEKTTITPQLEKVFEVIHVQPKDFQKYLDRKNLLIVSAFEPRSQVDKLLEKALEPEILGKIRKGEEYLFVGRNQWAIGQFMVVLAAKDLPTLKENIEVFPDFIYDLFARERDRRYRQELFWRTEATIERKLRREVGWTLKVPPRFEIVKMDPDTNRIVWLRRTYPDLNIFVHWEDMRDEHLLTSQWVADKLGWIGREYYDGAKMVPGMAVWRRDAFQGKPAVYAYGLWEIEDKSMGGPFKAIAFFDTESRRAYLIDLVVYAPTHRKEPLIRRLELVAETFSLTR